MPSFMVGYKVELLALTRSKSSGTPPLIYPIFQKKPVGGKFVVDPDFVFVNRIGDAGYGQVDIFLTVDDHLAIAGALTIGPENQIISRYLIIPTELAYQAGVREAVAVFVANYGVEGNAESFRENLPGLSPSKFFNSLMNRHKHLNMASPLIAPKNPPPNYGDKIPNLKILVPNKLIFCLQ